MDDFDDDDVDNDQSLDDFINREDGVIEDEEEFNDGGFNFGDDAHTRVLRERERERNLHKTTIF